MSSENDVTLTEEEEQESLLWEEYLEEGEYDYQRPKRGEIRDGVILRKDADQILVDIGTKREGVVPSTDLEKLGPEAVAELEVGDQVSVYVLRPESRDGDVIISINMARQMADWDEAEKLMREDVILEKEVTGFNKGGILVQVGNIQGFVPRSHIVDLSGRTTSAPPQERLNQMIGRELPLKIIEVNRRQRRLILSERAAWREWRAEQKRRLLADLEVGDIRSGTVTSLADFGAFIDLGGADGLIHLSELSWDRGKKPSEILRVGDEVEVKIISLDRERKRIGLSVKQLKPNPWEMIEERYAIGQYVDVEISNLAKFGAFARLEEGIEGLIHISELAEHNVQHPNEVVRPGQVLTVQILGLDPQRKRVGLSLRRVPEHLRTQVEADEGPEAEEEPGVAEAESAEIAEIAVEQQVEEARPDAAVASDAPEEFAELVGAEAEQTQVAEAVVEEAGEVRPEEPAELVEEAEAEAEETQEQEGIVDSSIGVPAEAQLTETSLQQPFDTTQEEPFDTTQEEPFDTTQEEPFDTTQEEPFDTTQEEPFDTTQEEPFDIAEEEPFDTAQEPFDIAEEEPFDTAQDDVLPEPQPEAQTTSSTAASANGDKVPDEDSQTASSSEPSREPQVEHQG